MNEQEKAQAEKTKMQNVVQQMLPDDLKKQFVLQKNTEGGLEKTAQKPPITFDPSGNVAAPAAPKLDPNLVQKAIRTFESDLAEALAQKNGSTSSIVIAEKKRKEEESRKAEAAAAPVPPPQPQVPPKVFVKPVAPTAATAIPGAAIAIPPTMAHDINIEIEEALKAANPKPVTPPSQAQQPIAQPVQVAPSIPHTAPIIPPINLNPVVAAPTVAAPVTQSSPPKRVIISGEKTPSRLKPILLMVVSLVLIGGGLYQGYFLYQKTLKPEPTGAPAPIIIPSIIPHDQQVSISVTNETGNQLISKMYAELNKRQVGEGRNLEVLLTKNTGTTPTRIGGAEFISKTNIQMPDVIERSLTDRWMFGVYGEETGVKTTFLALTTDFFQNAFAGMLSWEDEALADDLALLLNFRDRARRDELNATSTQLSSYFTIKGTYSDKVIRNRDVREFRNEKGELLFLYSFINKETLLLTTTESAFIALVDRIEKDAYVR